MTIGQIWRPADWLRNLSVRSLIYSWVTSRKMFAQGSLGLTLVSISIFLLLEDLQLSWLLRGRRERGFQTKGSRLGSILLVARCLADTANNRILRNVTKGNVRLPHSLYNNWKVSSYQKKVPAFAWGPLPSSNYENSGHMNSCQRGRHRSSSTY